MNNTNPKTLNDAQIADAAINLRLRNLTYAEISETLGISKNRATRIIKESIDKYNSKALSNTEALRAMVAMRYERFLDHWTQPATEEHDYRAGDLYLRTLRDMRDFLALDIKRVEDDETEDIEPNQSLIINVVGASPSNDDEGYKPKIIEVLSDGDDNSTTEDEQQQQQ